VLARERGGLYSALTAALEQSAHVRPWGGVPPLREVRAGDVLVVDLRDPPRYADLSSLESCLAKGAGVCLVIGDSLIAPAWVEIARLPGVRILHCSLHDGQRCHSAVVAELLERVRGPTGERITTLVLQSESVLLPVEWLVQAICVDPWRIRRPRDLANRCAISMPELRRRCAAIGFTRVEHFMIYVRLVVYEQLVAVDRLPPATARLRAGFLDPSNMRRHARRAARRSLPVARVLDSLPAGSRRVRIAIQDQEIA
jgi:hypothetical protein